MDVADLIVVMANGRIEQVGSPDQLYDEPANDFVMSFLGPVTRIHDQLVRPHDLELSATPDPDALETRVVRVVRLGFEVRVDLATSDGTELWAQVTRAELDRLAPSTGSAVWVRPAPDAVVMPTGS